MIVYGEKISSRIADEKPQSYYDSIPAEYFKEFEGVLGMSKEQIKELLVKGNPIPDSASSETDQCCGNAGTCCVNSTTDNQSYGVSGQAALDLLSDEDLQELGQMFGLSKEQFKELILNGTVNPTFNNSVSKSDIKKGIKDLKKAYQNSYCEKSPGYILSPSLNMRNGQIFFNIEDLQNSPSVVSAHDLLAEINVIQNVGNQSRTISGVDKEITLYINGKLPEISASELSNFLKSLPAAEVKNVEFIKPDDNASANDPITLNLITELSV